MMCCILILTLRADRIMELKICWNFKKSEQVDLETFLSDFIRVRYNEQSLESLRSAIKALHALRNAAIPKSYEKDPPELEKIAEYYFSLKIIEPLINTYEGQDFIRTTWYDSAKKSIFSNYKKTDLRLSFEIANVLHILGNTLWKKAEEIDEKDTNLIKTRINLFQLASAVFERLKKTVIEGNLKGMLSDLSSDNAEILMKLCLIRAQMGYIFKCKSENKTDFLLRMTYFNYEQSRLVYDLFKKSNNDRNMEPTIQLLYYYSVIDYSFYQFEEDVKNKEYGNSIFRLMTAMETSNEVHKLLNTSSSKDLNLKIKNKLLMAKKENDLIYHQRVPDKNPNSDLKPMQVACLPEINLEVLNVRSSYIIENFKKLVPGIVRNATKLFLNCKAQNFSSMFYEIDNSDSLISNIFAELNIPAIFEKTSEDCLPQSIYEKCQKLKSSDGLCLVLNNMRIIEESRAQCMSMINEGRNILRNEEIYDSNMIAKYPGLWNRVSSTNAGSSWRDCLEKYQNYINNSQKSDGILIEQFKLIKPSLDVMISDPINIHQLLDIKNNVINKLGTGALCDIKNIYLQLIKIQNDRKNAVKSIEMSESEIDYCFLNQVSSDGTLNVEEACQKLLNSFQPQTRAIRESLENQSLCIDKLMSYNDQLKSFGQNSPKLEIILKHYDFFISLKKGFREGVEFYRKLDANLKQLIAKIRDFNMARISEAEDLIQHIQYSRANVFQQQVYPSYTTSNLPVYPTAYMNTIRPQNAYNPMQGSSYWNYQNQNTNYRRLPQ